MRYDDALPALIRTALDSNINLEDKGRIVLRDATGRIGVVFSSRGNYREFSAKLKEVLGPYTFVEPVLPSSLFNSINEIGARDVVVFVNGDLYQLIRLVDRQIVGADWLSDLVPPSKGAPRLVFGSLKGGVGRTTALSVLAADLAAHGKRVLCIDLDVEAPGLSTMLLKCEPQDDRRPKYGVLDYLIEGRLNEINDDELFDFIGVSHFADGSIHVLPAVGRITDEHPENMIGKLSRGLVEEINGDVRNSVATRLRRMIDRFSGHHDYDAVLVDARAGLAEVTAGAWLGVGAVSLLLFGTEQRQTFSGYRYVLAHLVQSLGVSDDNDNDWRTRITFVHGKAPSSGNGQAIFRERLYELCWETLYEAEGDECEGWLFNFGFDESGVNIPHDSTHVFYHAEYDVFAPLEEGGVLREDIYQGPFGAFLKRSWRLLGWERPE